MRTPLSRPPYSLVEPVTELLHGVSIADPYRWLENQDSFDTRTWLEAQTRYSRSYLDAIPERNRIRRRVEESMEVTSYDSIQKAGKHYFFRKRFPEQEQPCICIRSGLGGDDEVLINPIDRGTGPFTSVRPLLVSANERFLLYEVKEGGERSSRFEILDIDTRKPLPDHLPRGFLSGFVFSPDGTGFYYVHEPIDAERPVARTAYHHVFGTEVTEDRLVFRAGTGDGIRLSLVGDGERLLCLVYRFLEKVLLDVCSMPTRPLIGDVEPLFLNLDCSFDVRLLKEKIIARTDRDAPNHRIVEIRRRQSGQFDWVDLVPERSFRIQQWLIANGRIYVSYIEGTDQRILSYPVDGGGPQFQDVPTRPGETVRFEWGNLESEELILREEGFRKPPTTISYFPLTGERRVWEAQDLSPNYASFVHAKATYQSRDGWSIPLSLVGRPSVVAGGLHPTILTSYGGFGTCITPRFSILLALLMEAGCLIALPSIRGGSEFGANWHAMAMARKRQTAFDDFLRAAEWLIEQGKTTPDKLAILGGSNSGLLVGVALTQRPDLFRAVVCIAPLLDMLRYHRFDSSHVAKREYGTSEDPEEFAALLSYSPYHRVEEGKKYPAVMMVSGDLDQVCNPLHARKMTARLQAASSSTNPIVLDYNGARGHSPVLPLSMRIEALTDRLAFLCDQLGIAPGDHK
jgi:prolyl oligopeptidase